MKTSGVHRVGLELLVGAAAEVPIRGGCMGPAIPPGSRARVAPCRPSGLVPGDMVVMERNARSYVHRYLGSVAVGRRRLLLTMADRAWRPDSPWSPGSLVGRVVEIATPLGTAHYRPGSFDRLRAATLWLAWLVPLVSLRRRALWVPRPRRR